MDNQKKAEGRWVYTGFREDGSWKWPPQEQFLTTRELEERRKLRTRGLVKGASLGYRLFRFFRG